MTTTTVDPRVVDDTATVLAALADLSHLNGKPCEWNLDCPKDAPRKAEWFAVTVLLCEHEQTDWLACGRCLQWALRHINHGCDAFVRCSTAGCEGRLRLVEWLLRFHPIEQPTWATTGGGGRG